LSSKIKEIYDTENKVVVDRSTGEIVDCIKKGDYIRRKETTDYLNETVLINEHRQFTKLFLDIRYIAKDLRGASLAVAIVLQSYIRYTSNIVSYSNGKPIMNEDIIEITNYSKPTITKCMDELVSNKVFARVMVGHYYQYYANPYIFCRGQRVNKTLVDMFKNYKYIGLE
jgi:hypothetical protein